MKFKMVALVPMRHESVRVPGKNYRPFAGKPLFHHILMTLSQVPQIDAILVDTDSDLIIDDIKANFPEVNTLIRPESLRGDEVPMNKILLYDTSIIDADVYLQTHSTNPLLRPETIADAIKVYTESLPQYDSLFGVTRLQTRLWDQSGQPLNHDPKVLLRTQDLPPVYEENSCIYIFTKDSLQKRQNRLGERPLMYEIPPLEAWDIDEELDFVIAETLYRHLRDSSY
jgi:CMP-N-acetylneuraminic acid synthetase